jgi:hypothetical protein
MRYGFSRATGNAVACRYAATRRTATEIASTPAAIISTLSTIDHVVAWWISPVIAFVIAFAITRSFHDVEVGGQALHGVLDAVQGACLSYAQRSADFVSSHA